MIGGKITWGDTKAAGGLAVAVCLAWCVVPTHAAGPTDKPSRRTTIRAGRAGAIVSVTPGANPIVPRRGTGGVAGTLPPRPRLSGFSPLVVITTSDAHRPGNDFEFEHDLHTGYVGAPLTASIEPDVVVGFLDSGATVDLAAGGFATSLGLTGTVLTNNTIGLGGVGDPVDGILTNPVAFFAAGLSAVDAGGNVDFAAMVGHSNVSAVVAPSLNCGNGETLTAVVGTPLMAFYTSVIHVDSLRTVTVNGVTYTSPDIELLDPFGDVPILDHFITMNFGGLAPATTANFFPDFETFEIPVFPTMLSTMPGSIPTGGAFFADILVRKGDPSPDNPAQSIRVLVDTGAQSSIISPGVAANLSLPITPHFTVDVCGVGGLATNVPGYYIDFVRMNALGGAIEFSRAPFIVLDLQSPEGGSLDGILGMNFFWNRNVIFDPFLTGTGFLQVSDPLPFAYADFDLDFDVDRADMKTFVSCVTPPRSGFVNPECTHIDANEDEAVDLRDFGIFQRCFSGDGVFVDPTCGG